MRLLVVEDDPKMAGLLRRGLVEEGHAADVARGGDDALWMAQAVEDDATLLHLMLPGVDGFRVCRRLGGNGVWSPVLMLTARDGVEDRVAGLDAGANDFLPKPFSFAELLARLRALARRGAVERPTGVEGAGLRPHPPLRGARLGGGRGDRPLSEGVRTPRDVHAPARPGAHALPAARARVGLRVREP